MTDKYTLLIRFLLPFLFMTLPLFVNGEKIQPRKAAADHYISVRSIPSLEKLPLTAIHRVFQDSEGFMWYGTFDGLCRYDGYNIKVFRSDFNNPGILRDNYISYIEEGPDGKIWIGTMCGLYLLDKKDYSIKPVDLGKDNIKNVFTLSVTNDWTVWASVPGKLYQLDRDGNILDSFVTERNGENLCAYFVYDMPEDRKITSLNTSRMFEIDFKKHKLVPFFHDSKIKDIERILPDEKNGCYWLGTWGSGIVRFDPKASNPESVYHMQSPATDALGNPVKNFYHMVKDDNLGYIWATTERDLFAFKTTDGKTLSSVDLKGIIPEGNKLYYEIFKDNDGSLWVSSFDNPSIVVDFNPGMIRYEKLETFRKSYRNTPMIMSMTVASDGTQWFGLDSYGLFMNTPQGDLAHFSTDTGNPGIYRFLTLSKGSDNSVWATTYGPKVINMGRSGDKISLFRIVDFSNDDPSIKSINHVFEDSAGRLWGAADNGILYFDLHKKEFSRIKRLRENFSALTQLTDGSICAIGNFPGIILINGNMEASIHKAAQRFNNIASTSDGTLWLSTIGGDILSYNPKNHTLIRQTAKAGFNGEKINDITIDRFNHIWITGNQIVREFNPHNGAYRTYTTRHDNFPLMRFTENSTSLTPEGDISVGGIGGILTIPATQALEGMPQNMATHITDVIVNGKSKLADGLENINGDLSIRLKPEDANLEIQFSNLHYRHPDHIRYAYRMEGVDNDWIYTGQRRNSAFYNRLKAGAHSFEVKATDSNGLWSDKTAILHIYREPFWHETWWAKTLFVLAVLSIGYLVIQYYRKSRHQKLLRERLKELLDSRENMEIPQSTHTENTKNQQPVCKPVLSSTISLQTADQDLLQRAVECVERRLGDENFDVISFAFDMNMSKATLTRKLKGVAGQSPAEFVREIRMRHAARMLENPGVSVTEVSFAIGYSDPRHFASLFKATFGMPPTQYQASAAEKHSKV